MIINSRLKSLTALEFPVDCAPRTAAAQEPDQFSFQATLSFIKTNKAVKENSTIVDITHEETAVN